MPPPCKPVVLTIDQEWHESPGMGSLAAVFQQDMTNMPMVQKGMKSRGFRGPLPNPHQERKITNFHRNLATYMGTGAPRLLK